MRVLLMSTGDGNVLLRQAGIIPGHGPGLATFRQDLLGIPEVRSSGSPAVRYPACQCGRCPWLAATAPSRVPSVHGCPDSRVVLNVSQCRSLHRSF